MQKSWRQRPGDSVVRHPREEEIRPLHIAAPSPRVPAKNFGSPYLLLGGFAILISVGTALLLLPFTNTSGNVTPFTDALFTATSAVTVTGLVVVNTPTYWTFPGQLIIMLLIFTGGLGIMTSATFLLIIVGQRITLSNRLHDERNSGRQPAWRAGKAYQVHRIHHSWNTGGGISAPVCQTVQRVPRVHCPLAGGISRSIRLQQRRLCGIPGLPKPRTLSAGLCHPANQ